MTKLVEEWWGIVLTAASGDHRYFYASDDSDVWLGDKADAVALANKFGPDAIAVRVFVLEADEVQP